MNVHPDNKARIDDADDGSTQGYMDLTGIKNAIKKSQQETHSHIDSSMIKLMEHLTQRCELTADKAALACEHVKLTVLEEAKRYEFSARLLIGSFQAHTEQMAAGLQALSAEIAQLRAVVTKQQEGS